MPDYKNELNLCDQYPECAMSQWACNRLQDMVYDDTMTKKEKRDLAVEIRKDIAKTSEALLSKRELEARVDEADTILTVLETTHPDFRLKQVQLRIAELQDSIKQLSKAKTICPLCGISYSDPYTADSHYCTALAEAKP